MGGFTEQFHVHRIYIVMNSDLLDLLDRSVIYRPKEHTQAKYIRPDERTAPRQPGGGTEHQEGIYSPRAAERKFVFLLMHHQVCPHIRLYV